ARREREQLGVRRDPGGQRLDALGARNLEPVVGVVLEAGGLEQALCLGEHIGDEGGHRAKIAPQGVWDTDRFIGAWRSLVARALAVRFAVATAATARVAKTAPIAWSPERIAGREVGTGSPEACGRRIRALGVPYPGIVNPGTWSGASATARPRTAKTITVAPI